MKCRAWQDCRKLCLGAMLERSFLLCLALEVL
jgi:hypothetical protein